MGYPNVLLTIRVPKRESELDMNEWGQVVTEGQREGESEVTENCAARNNDTRGRMPRCRAVSFGTTP